jgi:ABC-2 type transport system permease protein
MNAFFREYTTLTKINLLELRSWGPLIILFTTAFPLMMIYGFGVIGGGVREDGLLYVVTGTAVMSLVTIAITATAQELGEMRTTGVFRYYASLPISMSALTSAIITVRMLTAIPGVIVTIVAGAVFYDLSLHLNIATLVMLPLTAIALSGVGAIIGVMVPDFRVVALLSQATLLVVMFISPVLIPNDQLPEILQWLGYLLPPTYAADGLRRSLMGISDVRLLLDIAVLGGWALASLLGVSRALTWQMD